MDKQRYRDLQWGGADRLTSDEMAEGWHWCPGMDDLLCIRGSEDCFCSEEGRAKRDLLRGHNFDFGELFND